MAAGQHSQRDDGVPAARAETARRASLEVSRRTLLGAPLVPLILSGAERSRSALSKGAPALAPVVPAQAGTPARPAPSPSHWDAGLRRDDEQWNDALARLQKAQALLDEIGRAHV